MGFIWKNAQKLPRCLRGKAKFFPRLLSKIKMYYKPAINSITYKKYDVIQINMALQNMSTNNVGTSN